MTSNWGVVERYTDAHVRQDWDEIARLLHPEFVATWPQSGEMVRGAENFTAILKNYPGSLSGASIETRRTSGTDDHWVMSPSMTLIRIVGEGDTFTYEARVRYPNGETWNLVSITEIRDDKVWRQTDYFAPPFEAPEWRSQWVERVEEVAT